MEVVLTIGLWGLVTLDNVLFNKLLKSSNIHRMLEEHQDIDDKTINLKGGYDLLANKVSTQIEKYENSY